MHSEIVNVTPELAREFLSKSAGNPRFDNEKKVNLAVVQKYAADMKNGRWNLTPQGISFNVNGEMEDGHHRCHAIIEANVPVTMYVTYEAPVHVIYDSGYQRTPSQVLKHTFGVGGTLASSNCIAIAKMHMYFENGENRKKMESKTVYDVCDFICTHQDSLEKTISIQKKQYNGKKILGNASFGHAVFSALCCDVSFQTVSDFADIVQTGFCNSETKYAAILARNEITQSARSMDIVIRAYQSKYMQTCLSDFCKGIRRVRKYSNPTAIYTQKMLDIG